MILNHEMAGQGPHVLLLHPVGLDLTFLRPLAGILGGRYRVLSLDLRGHGNSPAAPPARGLDDYVEDIHATLAELEFAPAAVAGFSFGGMLAQELALKYPQDVSALALCACPSTLPEEGRKVAAQRGTDAENSGMAAVLDATLARWFTEDFRKRGGDEDARERLLTNDVSGWARAWHAISTLDALPRLGALRVPTVCIAGELDVSSPPAVLRGIAEAIAGARYVELTGAPHMLFIEQPQETAEALLAFFDEVLGAPRPAA